MIQPAGSRGGSNWEFLQGTKWEFQVPVRSTAPFTGQFQANVKSLTDQNDQLGQNPWIRPTVTFTVFPNTPVIFYPDSSTRTSAAPDCSLGGQCVSDGDCPAGQACYCGYKYQSSATLASRGRQGKLYFEIGKLPRNYTFTDTPD